MFHTNRLQFRKYPMDDLDFYVSLWRNEQAIRYIGKGTPKTYEQCKKSLESRVLPGYEDGLGLFLMLHRETEKPMGHAGLVRQRVDGKEEIEIGYWLLQGYFRKRFAEEAAAAFRGYGFQVLQLQKLVSLINPDHPASIFVARKTGMAYEKTLLFHDVDVFVYTMKRAGLVKCVEKQ